MTWNPYPLAYLGAEVFQSEREKLKPGVDAFYQDLRRQVLHASPEHPYGRASDSTIRPDWLAFWNKAQTFFQAFSYAESPGFWLDWLRDLVKQAEALGIPVLRGTPIASGYLGADPPAIVRDHRGERPPARIPPRAPRPQPRPDDRVPIQPQPRPDDRVPIQPQPQPQPQPQQPDPRVTTRPEDLRPRRDDDRRDWRRHRRYRDRYDLPWGQRYYGDYIFMDEYGWLPRWYPYWDPQWFNYWWYLFDYYGGDSNPDYAAYARDAVLRSFAPRYGWR